MRRLPAAAHIAAALGALMLIAPAPAQGPAPDDAPPARTFAVRCGTLLLGDGGAPLRDAWLVVRDGKVAAASVDAPPADLPVIDVGDRVVMPGIVAVDSDLAAAADGDYAVTPDVLAIDGFDFEERLWDALEGGVTSAYLSPGRERLVSGQGAVVKTAGRDLVQRVLSENACLRINLGDGATAAPTVFEPTVHPTDDDPLLPARVQTPTARISVLAELRAVFADAAGSAGSTTPATMRGEGAAQNHYDIDALQAVTAGRLPLRAAAWRAGDIRRALLLQRELGAPMVLENPQELAPLAATARAQGLSAVFRLPVMPGRSNPGGDNRRDRGPEPHLDAPARAERAGLPVAVAPWPGVPMRDYLLAPALAVRHGLSRAQALRGIGRDAAAILGVQDRVGTLQKGMDADFVVLSGDPLAIGTMVESTWIDGVRAFARRGDQRLLAVRCGAIHDGTGRVLRHGVLIVEGSKVKAIGEDLAVPYGARVLDLPTAVMTPGFVDACSRLGLAGDGTGVPNGTADQRLDLVIAHDDPMFAPALAAGVTTVLVSGNDTGLQSGRIAAIKTGARDHAGMVLRPVCGQRLLFDAIGPDSDKPLRDLLERGKAYVKVWADYDKALAAFRAGDKPAAEKPAPEPKADAPVDPVTGTWEAELDIQGRFQIKVLVDLKLEGSTVTGSVRMTLGERELPPQEVSSGTYDNGHLRVEFRGMGGTAVIDGTVADDVFDGTVSIGPMGEQPFKARRISKTVGAAGPKPKRGGTADDGSPKRPDVDESLEPLRAALDGRAALVVRVRRYAAVRAVTDLLTAEKVPFVLHDPDGLLDPDTPIGDARPPVLLDPDVVHSDSGRIDNDAAVLADRDLPLLFGTGDCLGAQFLPVHAAYAVRYGLAPDQALQALTQNAARAFRLDDRIGTLQRGRDADFAVFSGDPFEPTSRVLLVGCNGEVVVDQREDLK